jgi:hypothetical protein
MAGSEEGKGMTTRLTDEQIAEIERLAKEVGKCSSCDGDGAWHMPCPCDACGWGESPCNGPGGNDVTCDYCSGEGVHPKAADLLRALAALANPAIVREGKGVVEDPHGPARGALLCLGCGKLPPHTGSETLCPACAPPNGTCSCPGCDLAQTYRNRMEGVAASAPGERCRWHRDLGGGESQHCARRRPCPVHDDAVGPDRSDDR